MDDTQNFVHDKGLNIVGKVTRYIEYIAIPVFHPLHPGLELPSVMPGISTALVMRVPGSTNVGKAIPAGDAVTIFVPGSVIAASEQCFRNSSTISCERCTSCLSGQLI